MSKKISTDPLCLISVHNPSSDYAHRHPICLWWSSISLTLSFVSLKNQVHRPLFYHQQSMTPYVQRFSLSAHVGQERFLSRNKRIQLCQSILLQLGWFFHYLSQLPTTNHEFIPTCSWLIGISQITEGCRISHLELDQHWTILIQLSWSDCRSDLQFEWVHHPWFQCYFAIHFSKVNRKKDISSTIKYHLLKNTRFIK